MSPEAEYRHCALLVAGGTGTRLGGDIPKQFIPVHGIPVLVRTAYRFLEFSPDLFLCISIHPEWKDLLNEMLEEYFTDTDRKRMIVCEGGNTRTQSVHNGLIALSKTATPHPELILVAIHDAVRPFVTADIIRAAYRMAREKGNATVCVPVKSSIRMKKGDGSEAVNRDLFYHVQTPQVFRLTDMIEAFRRRPHDDFTDDASLAEATGMNIFLCDGSYDNIKITTPEDLAVAEYLAGREV